MKLISPSIAGLLLLALITATAHARGGGRPAFTAGTVDAAMRANQYNQEEPVDGLAVDLPAEPLIYCRLVNEVWVLKPDVLKPDQTLTRRRAQR